MVKIIGIPSEQEARVLYEEWKKERDDWNREAKKHDTILCWSVVFTCILAVVGITWSVGWSFSTDTLGTLRILALCLIPIVGFFIIAANYYGQWEFNNFSWPTQYKYYDITKDKTVLESKVKNNDLHLILETKDHEVVEKCIGFCNTKIRTDIDEVVVDLKRGEILVPYKKRECV